MGARTESGLPKLLVEKPFGHDTESARTLINLTKEHFDEAQIFRIDHYIAKETAQNILTFRFENPLFESIWNARHVASIKLSAIETIGIEGRGAFYDQTGALRDIIQSHLLQVLALITMERPLNFGSTEIHRSKQRLLDSIMPIETDEVAPRVTRGQYEGYRTHYKWDNGLSLRDWRYVVRIANIDVSNLSDPATAANIAKLMVKALHRIPNRGMGRPVFYMNRTIGQALDLQSLEKTSLAISVKETEGEWWTSFRGVPIRETDALLETEARVV